MKANTGGTLRNGGLVDPSAEAFQIPSVAVPNRDYKTLPPYCLSFCAPLVQLFSPIARTSRETKKTIAHLRHLIILPPPLPRVGFPSSSSSLFVFRRQERNERSPSSLIVISLFVHVHLNLKNNRRHARSTYS